MKRDTLKNSKGFTLIELMVTIGIIGALVQIAQPAFLKMKITAARAESNVNLNAMFAFQKTYHAETGTYGKLLRYGRALAQNGITYCHDDATGTLNEIGFRATKPCEMRYYYSAVNDQDNYNNVSDPTLQKFGGLAMTDHYRNGPSSSFQYGKGLGFSEARCPRGATIKRYIDARVINQNRESGFLNEGYFRSTGLEGFLRFYDANKQCK